MVIKFFKHVVFYTLQIRKDFENWGLEFEDKPVDLTGRVLASETIMFAKGTQPVDQKGDFTLAFRCKLNKFNPLLIFQLRQPTISNDLKI